MPEIPIEQQIVCVEREIGYRRWVYPRRVQAKRMSQRKADHELAAMEAVLETLKRAQVGQGRLF